jgi:transposase InsO family protein
MRFAFMREHRAEFPVALMCEHLDVSASGFHRWLREPASRRATRDAALFRAIVDVHETVDDDYGSPRVHRELRNRGVVAGRHAVARVMRKFGIRAASSRRFRVRTTDSSHGEPVAPDLLGRDFSAGGPNRAWACDITYGRTGEGFLYLAGVMDLFSRRVVGWSMRDDLGAGLCVDALRMAVARRAPPAGLVHHSDRGSQYASAAYRAELDASSMRASMSRAGDCYDNAPVESLWATLKKELVHKREFATHDEARRAIFEWIETVYNRTRMHSALGYVSPERFEASHAA